MHPTGGGGPSATLLPHEMSAGLTSRPEDLSRPAGQQNTAITDGRSDQVETPRGRIGENVLHFTLSYAAMPPPRTKWCTSIPSTNGRAGEFRSSHAAVAPCRSAASHQPGKRRERSECCSCPLIRSASSPPSSVIWVPSHQEMQWASGLILALRGPAETRHRRSDVQDGLQQLRGIHLAPVNVR